MDKVESYYFMFTRQIKDRPHQDGFTTEEYRRLLRKIIDWCKTELHGKGVQ